MVTDQTQIAYSRSNKPFPDGHSESLYNVAVKLKLTTYDADLKSLRPKPHAYASFAIISFASHGGASHWVLRVLYFVHTESGEL